MHVIFTTLSDWNAIHLGEKELTCLLHPSHFTECQLNSTLCCALYISDKTFWCGAILDGLHQREKLAFPKDPNLCFPLNFALS